MRPESAAVRVANRTLIEISAMTVDEAHAFFDTIGFKGADLKIASEILKEIRSTYDGPVAVAIDYMVFNVTKDDIRVRMAAVEESIWPLPSVTKKLDADPSKRVGFSDFISSGRKVFKDVVKGYYDETNKEFGTNYQPPK